MKIYIANFPGTVTCAELTTLFQPFGTVNEPEIATDAFTGVSRGFGYVTMNDDEAQSAIAGLNGRDWQGNLLTVEEAPAELSSKGSYKVGSGPMQAFRFRKN